MYFEHVYLLSSGIKKPTSIEVGLWIHAIVCGIVGCMVAYPPPPGVQAMPYWVIDTEGRIFNCVVVY
jgi:hypothetical protein